MPPEKVNPDSYCRCGCKRATGEPLPFCINEEEQTFLGPGVILFFFYTKRIFLVVCFSILIYGVFSLVTNLISEESAQNCDKPGGLFFMCELKVETEIANKKGRDEYLIPQLCLGLVMCIFWSISLRLIKALGRRKNQEIDDKLHSSADTHIFLENLPVGNFYEEELLDFVEELWKNVEKKRSEKLKIKSVQIIYNMDEVRQTISETYKLAKEICKCFEGGTTGEGQKIREECLEKYKQLKADIISKEKDLEEIREEFLSDKLYRASLTGECALVEFGEEHQMEDFLAKYGEKKKSFLTSCITSIKRQCMKTDAPTFKGRPIQIIKSPEPSDILWQNCEKKKTLKGQAITWTITVLFSGFFMGFFFLLKELRTMYPD